MLSYEHSPGGVGSVPKSWPADSRIARAPDRDTLVMLAHPLCPCTQASMSELARVMAQTQGRLNASVVFFQPQGAGLDWHDTSLIRAASQIPGVKVVLDVDGTEAQRFGAETSGHTLLFDSQGHLLFSGGITASRGHEGDNLGENTIVALINNRAASGRSTSVFGCSLAGSKGKGSISAMVASMVRAAGFRTGLYTSPHL